MKKNYKLRRFEDAFIFATRVNERSELMAFGKHALACLEIDYGMIRHIYINNIYI